MKYAVERSDRIRTPADIELSGAAGLSSQPNLTTQEKD